jgi:hypothetical protein
MGSKPQRQNQHAKRLMSKIRRFEAKNKSVEGLKKELAHCMGEAERPSFKTGREADPRHRKKYLS